MNRLQQMTEINAFLVSKFGNLESAENGSYTTSINSIRFEKTSTAIIINP